MMRLIFWGGLDWGGKYHVKSLIPPFYALLLGGSPEGTRSPYVVLVD